MKIINEGLDNKSNDDNYIIIESNTLSSLKTLVNKKIQEGYLPIGCVIKDYNYIQPMLREMIKYGK